MSGQDHQVECLGWSGKPPPGVQCPPTLHYPNPPSPVDLLFLAWNAPGDTHFWNSPGDNLRLNLQWVFHQLAWPANYGVIDVFRDRRYFLVHAVRCWKKAEFGWSISGLIETCSRNSLRLDLERLHPKAICALGRLPHHALRVLWPAEIPEKVVYGRGWTGAVAGANVLITAFPNTRNNPARNVENRACTLEALRRWMPSVQFQPPSGGASSIDDLSDLLSRTRLENTAKRFVAAVEDRRLTDILILALPLVEAPVRHVLEEHGAAAEQSFHEMCHDLSRLSLLSGKAVTYLRTVQKLRNEAAHPASDVTFTEQDAMSVVNMVAEIIREGHGRGYW